MVEKYPKISIVTPSFNQARFLERTIRSILDQNYPNLEYVIIDGGSTDGSVEIIKKYADRLHYWVSEKDNGQYDALNKGFAHTTGEIMAYLNSDDIYLSWALQTVGALFHDISFIEWMSSTSPMSINADDRAVNIHHLYGFTKSNFFKGENLMMVGWPGTGFIQQESTFWRRKLWDRVGGKFDANLKYAGEFELWTRFFREVPLVGIDVPLAGFRYHDKQKTAFGHNGLQEYLIEAKEIFFRAGGKEPNHLLQYMRIFAHKCFLPRLRTFLIKWGILKPALVMVYNIYAREWLCIKR